MRFLAVACVVGVAAVAQRSANAQAVNFGIEKYAEFTQTADASVNPPTWLAIFSLHSPTLGAFVDPNTVTYDGPLSPENLGLVYDIAPYGQLWYGYSNSYSSQADLDTDVPATDYSFNVTTNNVAGGTFVLMLLPDSFPPEDPQFAGDTYSRLQLLKNDLASDFAGSINGFTDDPTSNSSAITILIKDLAKGDVWYDTVLTPVDTAFTIPGGTLAPGFAYFMVVYYDIGHVTDDARWNGGTTSVGWQKDTTITFNTRGPCPADLNGDGVVDDADFVMFVQAYNLLYCFDIAMRDKCPADLTNDGYVLDDDFVNFVPAYDQLLCDPE
ncbi:MAG: hypothetical protein ACREJD_03200 [Phycisphaerales bacterium]